MCADTHEDAGGLFGSCGCDQSDKLPLQVGQTEVDCLTHRSLLEATVKELHVELTITQELEDELEQ
jgi:hypothetical protein